MGKRNNIYLRYDHYICSLWKETKLVPSNYTPSIFGRNLGDRVRSKFSNTRCWFGWFFFNLISSQVVTTGTNSYLTGKTRVSAYKGDTADDISKPSIFLCRHRTISTSESRLTTYYSSHILSMHLRVVYAVTKSISTLIFISLRFRSARTERRSTI